MLSLAFVSTALSQDAEPVRIEQGKIDIAITSLPEPQREMIKAHVRTSFRITNVSSQDNNDRRLFPVVRPRFWSHQPESKPWCQVSVNGDQVATETKVLIDHGAFMNPFAVKTTPTEWKERLNQWIERDPKLHELVSQYRQLTTSRQAFSEVTREFMTRVKNHLIHANELDHTILCVAKGDPYFGYLVKLMPEIDPNLRIDRPYHRWKYVSLLGESNSESYRPYEQEWREKADQWFAARPELAELIPELRKAAESFRESQKLLNGPILNHLHDVNGLSLETTLQMKSFLESKTGPVPTALVRTLFADIRKQLDAEQLDTTKMLSKWGFDESSLSSMTGKLIPDGKDRTDTRFGWRDQSVYAELGRTPRPSNPLRWNRGNLLVPVLISFDAPLKAGESAVITLDHDTNLVSTYPLNRSMPRFGQTELAVVFPPLLGDVTVTVTCPSEMQPVIDPAPYSTTILNGDRRQFDVRIGGNAKMVHLAVVMHLEALLSQFRFKDQRQEDDLLTLIERTTNPTVRPLLMAALNAVLLKDGRYWDAQQLALRIVREHPDFALMLKSTQTSTFESKEAQRLHQWIVTKGKSPRLQSDADFRRFKKWRPYSSRDALTPKALSELTRRVELLDETELTLQEKTGRFFILCQAGVETQSNLSKLLQLAEANPKSTVESLKLIQFLTIDKLSALQYVLAQMGSHRGAAIGALSSFRSAKAAPELTQFICDSTDRFAVQSAIKALLQLTLPTDHADEELDVATGVIGRPIKPKDVAALEYRSGLPQHMNERIVSMIRAHGGDKSLFPFVEAYYLEHIRGKKSVNHRTIVDAFERIGDPRAVPYLYEIFETAERKSGVANAIGRLQLTKTIRIERVVSPFDRAIRDVTFPGRPEVNSDSAWQTLLENPDAAFQRAMQSYPLHGMLEGSHFRWSENQFYHAAFITRFGDVAARQLLAASEGCSLEKRYCVAKLLRFLLPESHAIVVADAKDESMDPDRKRTAQLALKLPKSDTSRPTPP